MAVGWYQRRPETVQVFGIGYMLRMGEAVYPAWLKTKIKAEAIRVFSDGIEVNTPNGWVWGTYSDVLVMDYRDDLFVYYSQDFDREFEPVEN